MTATEAVAHHGDCASRSTLISHLLDRQRRAILKGQAGNMVQRSAAHDQVLPKFVRDALAERGLVDLYQERTVAQREHYVRRIVRAVRAETVQKRLDQMLDELEGGIYMKQPWIRRPPT